MKPISSAHGRGRGTHIYELAAVSVSGGSVGFGFSWGRWEITLGSASVGTLTQHWPADVRPVSVFVISVAGFDVTAIEVLY